MRVRRRAAPHGVRVRHVCDVCVSCGRGAKAPNTGVVGPNVAVGYACTPCTRKTAILQCDRALCDLEREKGLQ